MKHCSLLVLLLSLFCGSTFAQSSTKIALLQYSGGGDWYSNPTSLPNLVKFCNKELGTNLNPVVETVGVGSSDLFDFPFVHMTGHGNVLFSDQDAQNLRTYLESGGFLHIDDNYGLSEYIRREMKKVFPKKEFVELPFSHPIYHQTFAFDKGLPKIHEHDNKPPQGYGLFVEERLVCFFTFECDLGDGWEDASVHNDPYEVRQKALKMGSNLVEFVFLSDDSSFTKK